MSMADDPGASETLESLPPVAAWRWLAAFGLAGSAAGWAGQRVWSAWAFVICIGVWELIWGVWRLRHEWRQGRGLGSGIVDLLFLVPLTIVISVIAAVALIQVSWAAWYLVEVALGGWCFGRRVCRKCRDTRSPSTRKWKSCGNTTCR
jgi:hypothetical protein